MWNYSMKCPFLSVWRFQVLFSLQWEWKWNEPWETPTCRIWSYSKSCEYTVLPLHHCLNWDSSGASSLPTVLTAAPCHRDEEVGVLPSFLPPPSFSPDSTQKNQPVVYIKILVMGQRWMEGRKKPSLWWGRISTVITTAFPQPTTMWQCLQTPHKKLSYLHLISVWKLYLLVQINGNITGRLYVQNFNILPFLYDFLLFQYKMLLNAT